MLRPASTDRLGTTVSLSTSWQFLTQLDDTNPDDSAAWNVAVVNALEAGYKLIS